MINNLNDLQAYFNQLDRSYPQDIIDFNFSSPGIDAREVAILKESLPYLDDDYLKCASLFNLKGVKLGYFDFSPSSFDVALLSESILRANGPLNLFGELFESMEMVNVAYCYTEPIVVQKGGKVFMFAHDNPKDFCQIAESFSLFLLAVGNLGQAGCEFEGQPAVDELVRRLQILGFPEDLVERWRFFAQETYLD
jgi:hypothetical protein